MDYHGNEKQLSTLDGFVLVIHGGAGTMSKASSTPETRKAYKQALAESLRAGYAVLREGGEALDAAVAAVSVMEDNPLFNAGKGAVFNTEGKNELEASIMLSKPPTSYHKPPVPATRRGVGLTLLTRVRNPSKLARLAYLQPDFVPHAFVSGAIAEDIGEALGVELVDPSYFFTEHRWREHRRGMGLPEEPLPVQTGNSTANLIELEGSGNYNQGVPSGPMDSYPTGTVGAVALDVRGCIAALTSTGGRTNKLPGRIGDTPLMGAGFWAEEWDEGTAQGPSLLPPWLSDVWHKIWPETQPRQIENKVAVGVSGTGDGDYFIRQATASTLVRRMQLAGETVQAASEKVVQDLFRDGGIGGVIALDSKGNVAMPLNCPGMYRGVIRANGAPKVAIFDDEELEEI